MSSTEDFDAIVIGSGATGGWAAKELCERGLKTLVLDRGRMVEHIVDYETDNKGKHELPFRGDWPPGKQQEYRLAPTARPENYPFYASDSEHPYVFDEEKPFIWIRPNIVGGKSIMWGRQCYRWSEQDFRANKVDGHGLDWPVRYNDIEPWYSHVEKVVGISGESLGLAQLPDSEFQPPMPMNILEKDLRRVAASEFGGRVVTMGRVANLTENMPQNGRVRCQYRNQCHRGCRFGAYFSTQSTTLPLARKTGNLTLLSDRLSESLEYDASTGKVRSVRVVDTRTGRREIYRSKIVFLCASCIATNQILMNSKSEAMPNGLGNTHDQLGRYVMDHIHGIRAVANFPGLHEEYVEYGRRPVGIYVPRFRNIDDADRQCDFLRGYNYQGAASRNPPKDKGGFGAELKNQLRIPGPWQLYLIGFGEVLPYRDNRMMLDERKVDAFGIPQMKFDVTWRENERSMIEDMEREGIAMLRATGADTVKSNAEPSPPGRGIHEMGGACMGADPRTSVVNMWNQMHVAPNVYVTDGAFMSSGSCVNPTLTLMAFTARAAKHAADQLRDGAL